MYKKSIFIFLLFALQRLSAQTWSFEPLIFSDSFETTVYVNYGDSAEMIMYNRIGQNEKLIPMQIHIHNLIITDTFINLAEGMYIFRLNKQNPPDQVKKTIYEYKTPIVHYKINLIINPESIPAETFIAYPNPVENGEINLLYSQDWANGIATISNYIGQILYAKSLSEIQNNQLKVNDLPTGNYILTVKNDIKKYSQIIIKK